MKENFTKFIENEIKDINNKLNELDKKRKLTDKEHNFRLELLGAYFELCTLRGMLKNEEVYYE